MNNLLPIITLFLASCGGGDVDTGEDTGTKDTSLAEEASR